MLGCKGGSPLTVKGPKKIKPLGVNFVVKIVSLKNSFFNRNEKKITYKS